MLTRLARSTAYDLGCLSFMDLFPISSPEQTRSVHVPLRDKDDSASSTYSQRPVDLNSAAPQQYVEDLAALASRCRTFSRLSTKYKRDAQHDTQLTCSIDMHR